MDGAALPEFDVPVDEVVTTASPEGLAAIAAPKGVSAAIWDRTPPPGFQSWIDGLAPSVLPSARLVLHADTVARILPSVFASCGTPASPHRDHLQDDISTLAQMFSKLTGAPYLRMRLEVVDTNACRKFHLDAVTVRLVCTYRGQGTQYGASVDNADPAQIHEVGPSAPILLRGSLWPGAARIALRHRSPPIEGTGETRLVLVFDPLMGPEDAA